MWEFFLVCILLLTVALQTKFVELVGCTMHCGTASFWVSYFKILTYTLSHELLFQRMQFFRTANFQQATWWVLDLKVPVGFTEWCITQKIFPLNTLAKTFASKLHWTGQTVDERKTFSFSGNLIKILNSVLNFSIEFFSSIFFPVLPSETYWKELICLFL